MKLSIFLDIDGVLNHEPETKDCGKVQTRVGHLGWVILCKKCISRLNDLVDYLHINKKYEDIDIILSSTWRRYFEPRELSIILACFGFKYRLAGRTAIDSLNRGQQILDYIRDNPSEHYIAIDDDVYDMDLVSHRQVVTNHRTGFNNTAYEAAIKLIEN